jgi:hypothetical protein
MWAENDGVLESSLGLLQVAEVFVGVRQSLVGRVICGLVPQYE